LEMSSRICFGKKYNKTFFLFFCGKISWRLHSL
jgi:hypothetical protein